MGHRQALGDHFVGGDVDHHAAVAPLVAPAVDDIGGRHRGDVARHTVLHRQTVEVAAVLRRKARDERRPPHRLEGMNRAVGGEAGIFGADEDQPAGGVDAHLVHVEVGNGLAAARHIKAVEVLVGALVGTQDILEAPDLREAREQQPLAVADQAHGAHEVALVQRQRAVGQNADEEELARLIGRESERAVVHCKPLRKPARARHVGDERLRRSDLGTGRIGSGLRLERCGGVIGSGRRDFIVGHRAEALPADAACGKAIA